MYELVTTHTSYRPMIQLMLNGHFDHIMLTAVMYLLVFGNKKYGYSTHQSIHKNYLTNPRSPMSFKSFTVFVS